MERITLRLEKKQKATLEVLAKNQGMSVTDYIKYKLFDQNIDLTNDEYIYCCPEGERYNYAIAGFSMLNYILLESLVEKAYGDEATQVINKSIVDSKKKLEQNYGYRKIKVKQDE